MKPKVYFQITLSAPQLDYLADKRYLKNRMAYFADLILDAALKPTGGMRHSSAELLQVGQIAKSESQLAKEWGCDRKTVTKVIDTMNELGLITTIKNHVTSVHTINAVAAWIVDKGRVANPNFRPGYAGNRPQTVTMLMGHSNCFPSVRNILKEDGSCESEL